MMKTCDQILDQLYEYFNRSELTEADRAEIKRHLEDCPPCGQAYDFEAKLLARLKDSCAGKCPDSLRARVRNLLGLQ